jgi:hypothetical protein
MPAKKNSTDSRAISLGLKISQSTHDKITQGMKATQCRSINSYVIAAIEAYSHTAATDEDTAIDLQILSSSELTKLLSGRKAILFMNSLLAIAMAAAEMVGKDGCPVPDAIDIAAEAVKELSGEKWYPDLYVDSTDWHKSKWDDPSDNAAHNLIKHLQWRNIKPPTPRDVKPVNLDEAKALLARLRNSKQPIEPTIAPAAVEVREVEIPPTDAEAIDTAIPADKSFEYPLLIESKRFSVDYPEWLEQHLHNLGGALPKRGKGKQQRLIQAIVEHGGKAEEYSQVEPPFGRFHVANSRRQEWLDLTHEEKEKQAAECETKKLATASI